MSERFYRVLLGVALITLLAVHWGGGVYTYIGRLLFEGITNQRVPLVVSRLRGDREGWMREPVPTRIFFDAERVLRLIIALLLLVSYVLLPDLLWFVPWFLGAALFMAGITGVCPMAIALKRIGFRP
jgi:hypothetical protein